MTGSRFTEIMGFTRFTPGSVRDPRAEEGVRVPGKGVRVPGKGVRVPCKGVRVPDALEEMYH